MLGKTHLLFSLFLSLLFLNFFSIEYDLLFVSLVLLGSLFPDIDDSSSIIGKKTKIFSWLFSHRGFFHSFYAAVIFSVIIYFFFGLTYSLAFFAGFFSHIFLDSFTQRGVSLFVFDRKIEGPFLSGGLFEKILYLVLIVLNIYLIIKLL